ncbi:hypothetical protein [Natronococcus roseus]|uniref:hypothetical protein n=1 Tax=Natronococcus roseus TaxID=1052014 RepID=UPI00374D5308
MDQLTDAETENEYTNIADLLADLDEVPTPYGGNDPEIKYVHPGKKYKVAGSDLEFEIVALYPDALIDGVVILESTDGSPLLHEYENENGGASRQALEAWLPEEDHRAAYTVGGILQNLRELEIGEVDHNSYTEAYHEELDRRERLDLDDGENETEAVADGGQTVEEADSDDDNPTLEVGEDVVVRFSNRDAPDREGTVTHEVLRPSKERYVIDLDDSADEIAYDADNSTVWFTCAHDAKADLEDGKYVHPVEAVEPLPTLEEFDHDDEDGSDRFEAPDVPLTNGDEADAVAVVIDAEEEALYYIAGEDHVDYPTTIPQAGGDGELEIEYPGPDDTLDDDRYVAHGEEYDSEGGQRLRELIVDVDAAPDPDVVGLARFYFPVGSVALDDLEEITGAEAEEETEETVDLTLGSSTRGHARAVLAAGRRTAPRATGVLDPDDETIVTVDDHEDLLRRLERIDGYHLELTERDVETLLEATDAYENRQRNPITAAHGELIGKLLVLEEEFED